MHPVIIGCPLQRLSRIDWSVHLHLLLAPVIGNLLGSLTSLTFFLFFLLRLLLVGILWRLDKIMFCEFNWAQYTFVSLMHLVSNLGIYFHGCFTHKRDLRVPVIDTHITGPFS